MDFANYTLGRLVPGRSNYDFKNQEYIKVRSQILWRIEQLGWSGDLFKDVERLIESENRRDRVGSDAKQTDRYGKKYSWIAFFEMSGFLNDLRKIESVDERDWSWSPDIDPSFPARSSKYISIKTDFLGDPNITMKEWIANGPLPNVDPYLKLAEIQDEIGSWILLDGYIEQESKTLGRSIFGFIRSFLVLSGETDSFMEDLSNQDLGGRWLPEKPSTSYTFAGEIPWSSKFAEHETSEISFTLPGETIKVERMQNIFFLDGDRLDLREIDLVRLQMGIYEQKDNERQFSREDIERIEVREISIEVEEVLEHNIIYNVIIPVCDFSWESDRSTVNNSFAATTLSKEIASDLALIGQPQSFDLLMSDGMKATLAITDNDNTLRLLYIREELLRNFLDENKLTLIWAIWGERGYSSDLINEFIYKSERPDPTDAVFQSIKHYE